VNNRHEIRSRNTGYKQNSRYAPLREVKRLEALMRAAKVGGLVTKAAK
jgi:hypothetical protein